ncbi:UNVERIFIED_CONTAM: hypothetical protein Sindi_1682800 [Sesamum indicum]
MDDDVINTLTLYWYKANKLLTESILKLVNLSPAPLQVQGSARSKKGTLLSSFAARVGSSQLPSATPSEGDPAPPSQGKEVIKPLSSSTAGPVVSNPRPLVIKVYSGDTGSIVKIKVQTP